MPLSPARAFLRIVYAAAPAGLVAGLLVTAIQQFDIVPLLRTAEAFETHHDHAPVFAATAVSNVVLATAFALILASVMSLRPPRSWWNGLLWTAAGYAVFFVAPSLTQPPQLPGTEMGALGLRQAWWIGTVAASATGLWLAVFAKPAALRILGLALIAMPHLIGAPQPATQAALAPAELAREFVRATYVANAALWLTIGSIVSAITARAR